VIIYGVASSMLVVRLWYRVEVGHVNRGSHALAVIIALSIVVIVESVEMFCALWFLILGGGLDLRLVLL
jgi:hypothetical protein